MLGRLRQYKRFSYISGNSPSRFRELSECLPGLKTAFPGIKPGLPGIKSEFPGIKPGLPEIKSAFPEINPGLPEIKRGFPEIEIPPGTNASPMFPKDRRSACRSRRRRGR